MLQLICTIVIRIFKNICQKRQFYTKAYFSLLVNSEPYQKQPYLRCLSKDPAPKGVGLFLERVRVGAPTKFKAKKRG